MADLPVQVLNAMAMELVSRRVRSTLTSSDKESAILLVKLQAIRLKQKLDLQDLDNADMLNELVQLAAACVEAITDAKLIDTSNTITL